MKCVLAEYFNEKGDCVHKLALETDGRLETHTSGMTSTGQGAYAAQALISDVVREAVSIHLARQVRSVGVDNCLPVPLSEVLPALETSFGATSIQWAYAIFTHLKIKPLSLQ